jgi:hypothetical protein
VSIFAGMPSGPHGSMQAMPHTPDRFEWEYPARVLSVIDGASFWANIDLGFNLRVQAVVVVDKMHVEPIETKAGMASRKEAQRLLADALVTIRSRKLFSYGDALAVLADVAYSPFFTPISEQGSFRAAMMASGHAEWHE